MQKRIDINAHDVSERLFHQHRKLAFHMAYKYARQWKYVCLDDLTQDLQLTLWRCAQLWKPNGGPPFSAFAVLCLKQKCWEHCRRYGWAPRELPLNEIIGDADDGEPLTWADVAESQRADAAERQRIPRTNQERLVALVLNEIDSLATLTDKEREILRLRYRNGLDNRAICRKVRGNVPTYAAQGIRKLRQAFLDRGFRALAPSAPVEHIGYGRAAANR